MTVPFPVLVPVAFSVRHDFPILVTLADPAAVEILPVLSLLAVPVLPVPVAVAAPVLLSAALALPVAVLVPFGVPVPVNYTIID